MTVLTTVLFAVLFFAAIMASIALHEIGHLVPAKLFGVRVARRHQFAVGRQGVGVFDIVTFDIEY